MDAISDLFDIKIETMRLNLLNSWLRTSDMDAELETTLLFPSMKSSSSNADDSDPNLKRFLFNCQILQFRFNQFFITEQFICAIPIIQTYGLIILIQ